MTNISECTRKRNLGWMNQKEKIQKRRKEKGGSMRKKNWIKRFTCIAMAAALTVGCFLGGKHIAVQKTASAAVSKTEISAEEITRPKYVFLFIGDGMSYPQIQISSDYLGALNEDKDGILNGNEPLNFMNFEAAGSAITYDSSSFCPDSASSATSLSTGHKTYSGVINMSEDKTAAYETITEKVKKQLGYQVGIITTVNLNHATPAAFYGHQASRSNYYELGLELIESDFDYFAGGAFLLPNGKNNKQKSLYQLAKQAGYQVIKTKKEAEQLTAEDEKVIVISETLADSNSLSYELDRKEKEWSLADYVEKGIEVLDNEEGFFLMVEGGKIDWACHANDAGSAIQDTLALADAVEKAIDFYQKHPEETLILVTGDHETGGLTIGFAGTNYDTFLTNLENQKISYAKYDSDYVAKYKKNKTTFQKVLKDIERLFGLVTPERAGKTTKESLILTEYELDLLKTAYEKTRNKNAVKENVQEQYVLYGTYEPLTVTITHILNHKSGISFSSYSHTGLPVAVFAQGTGAELFNGYYDNTVIYDTMAALLQVK